VKSKFGATFDQLADLCCFGIGPAIFFVRQALSAPREEQSGWAIREILAILMGYAYMACSVYRITRELIVHDGSRPIFFVGIPTNLACIFVVSVAAGFPTSQWTPIVVGILSFMMVMPVKIPKGMGLIHVTETEVKCNTQCNRKVD